MAKVGWIGLGEMGRYMASNLHTHLQKIGARPLVYTNRTLTRGSDLEASGAQPKQSVAEVVQSSDITFSCISNDTVLIDTVQSFINSGDVRGKILCDSSTVHPDTSAAVAEDLRKAGASFVAAPVFGASPMAKAGKLIFSVAGPAAARKAISPYLKDVMGKAVIDLGEDVSKSSMLKINGNILVVSFMEVIAEAHVFAEKTGLGSEVLENLIGENFGPVLHSYSKRLTSGAYAPSPTQKAGFDVNLSIKDAKHALNCADAAGVKLPVSSVALENMQAAKKFGEEQGGRAMDSSSMYGILRQMGGLDFYTDGVKRRDST
ncbi:putative 6-phosphogluconate dehydrogenase, NADP-binding, 6-phosphogluconate dehydrogenase, domain 2 [Septoria linicola]|nr:putative 6-phosphogluconate dehydrogenase, NADP-binding, 6-phosphogluconate dehydrogenase, domain 2 [Septoria linicola]